MFSYGGEDMVLVLGKKGVEDLEGWSGVEVPDESAEELFEEMKGWEFTELRLSNSSCPNINISSIAFFANNC